jgi:hypothetical protein
MTIKIPSSKSNQDGIIELKTIRSQLTQKETITTQWLTTSGNGNHHLTRLKHKKDLAGQITRKSMRHQALKVGKQDQSLKRNHQ